MTAHCNRRQLLRLGGTACALGVAGCLGDGGDGGDGSGGGSAGSGSAGGEWPTAGHDLRNTGSTDAAGPTSGVEKAWEAEAGARSGLVVADGAAFVADGENAYRVALDDGSTDWSASLPDVSLATPAVGGGTLYVGTRSGVRAFDSEDGEELWDAKPDERVGSVTVLEDTVLAETGSGTMFGLAPEDGSEQWQTLSNENRLAEPAVVDGTAYLCTDSTWARAVDVESGERPWEKQRVRGLQRPVAVDDTLYFVGDGLWAAERDTGETLWQTESWSALPKIHPAWADGTVYVGLDDGRVVAVDAEEGATPNWEFDLGTEDDIGHAVTVADGTVYATAGKGGEGHIYALDADTGDERWHETVSNSLNSEPVIAGGSLYVADVNHVYRFDEA